MDPGHGGKDPGGGINKYWKEKDMVLDISLYQYNRFKDLGVPIAITRTTDKYLDSGTRSAIVRNSGAKDCISNHINSGGGQGAEMIHSIFNDGKMAQAIADGLKEAGQNVRRVFTRKSGSGDYYYMHRETGNVSTTIVEYGFADNKTDTDRIRKHWKKYAESVVRSYCEYRGHKYSAPGKPLPGLVIDGRLGKNTTIAWQKAMGTPADGIISGQYRNSSTKPILSVDFGPEYTGSILIKAWQRKIGAKPDGFIGPETIRKSQKYLGTPVDGEIWNPSAMVKELQRRLNKGTLV
ncbi:N-acetylmuramoyl-L-alanine amidase family protein [Virgibacillus indicus]|uniref:N-acetylmuramoyl-L-alanine amidase family protein n=1 Tax=Virgibacillus indicus TaxID=2024554 RepID=UPI0023E82D81|nr:N-acetylmuramoyl-L-alanine amidase [Virgibacillus indicus]